jgi:hypothetical protein
MPPDSKLGNASARVDLGGASATSKHPAACSTEALLPLSNFLSEALLSWTIKDLLNDDLYIGKVLRSFLFFLK